MPQSFDSQTFNVQYWAGTFRAKTRQVIHQNLNSHLDTRFAMTDSNHSHDLSADYEKFLSVAVEKHGARILTLEQIADITGGKAYKPGQILTGNAFEQGQTANDVLVLRALNHRGKTKREIDAFSLKARLTADAASGVKQDQFLKPGDALILIVGKAGNVARFDDEFAIIRAVATDKHFVIHLRDQFAELFGKHGLSRLLSSKLYQKYIQSLADGNKVRKLDPRKLAGIKIPILPRDKAIILNTLFHVLPESSLEKILSVLDRHQASATAINYFSQTPAWRDFSKLPTGTPIAETRSYLRKLIKEHGEVFLSEAHDPTYLFAVWMRQFVMAAKYLEEILKSSPTAEKVLTLQGWKSELQDRSKSFQSALEGFRTEAKKDFQDIRDEVFGICDGITKVMLTLGEQSEHEVMAQVKESVPLHPLSREDAARRSKRARALTELWDMMRGSRLGGEEQYAYPFLWNLMLDAGTNDFPGQMDRNALVQLLAAFSSRSIIHGQACAWFQNILPRIPESEWIAVMRQFGSWLTHVDEGTAKSLIQDLLEDVEARAWRMTGWNSYPKELLTFVVEAARVPANGTVYVPYTPSFGFSRFLPSNAQGFFQFRSEHEAGIFAIHEVISGGHSTFVVADPLSEGTPFDENFSAAIAAPPFNGRAGRNEYPTEIRCIENALSVIKPGGRAVVCVSPAFLMRRGGRYAEYREHLTCSNLVEAVIQLPSRLLSGSSISLSLLVLDTSVSLTKETLFIDASDCVVSGVSERVPKLDVEKLLTRFSDGQHPSCRRVDEEGIRAKEYDLTPARYIAQQEIEVPEHHRLCRFGELVSPKRFPRCQPGDLGVQLTPRHFGSPLSVEPQSFESLEVVDAPGLSNPRLFNRANADALIVSPIFSKDGLGACLFHHNGRDLLLRPDMLTFEVSSDQIDPQWLMLALSSELTRRQLEPLVSTAGIPRVRRELLMDLILVVPDTKQQQRALLALHKESALKSRAKELGLEEHIQSIKKGFLDDLRLKKHSISQITNDIKSAIAVILDELAKKGSISAEQIISPRRSIIFSDYLQGMSQKCGVLGGLIDKLTEENKHEPLAQLNLADAMKKVEKEYRGENFQLRFFIESRSFVDQTTGDSIKPLIRIGENDFQILCRNIIDNAKRHAFKGDFKGASILVDAELLYEEQVIELCFMNNGAPFPKGMDIERFVLRGEKAGSAGNTGTGGYHIKSIMDHVGGRLEICSPPFDEYSTEIRLLFPICHDDTL